MIFTLLIMFNYFIFFSIMLVSSKVAQLVSQLAHVASYEQMNQYRIGGCTNLANGTIYFGYRSIPMYRFEFTAIFYICIYIYIYIYVCVRSQFVVQTYSAMAQDNKFVESRQENWTLLDSGYNYHNFKDSLNETAETNGKRFSI